MRGKIKYPDIPEWIHDHSRCIYREDCPELRRHLIKCYDIMDYDRAFEAWCETNKKNFDDFDVYKQFKGNRNCLPQSPCFRCKDIWDWVERNID